MNILPKLEEVKEIAKKNAYSVVPVSVEILSDFTTPIETMRILKNVSTHCYMLESAQADETWGRYTFLGFEPKLSITCSNGDMTIGDETKFSATSFPNIRARDFPIFRPSQVV